MSRESMPHAIVDPHVPAIARRLGEGRSAYAPSLGIVVVPSGQVYYDRDWVARKTLAQAVPPEATLREWATTVASALTSITDEAWMIGPAMAGAPSLPHLLSQE